MKRTFFLQLWVAIRIWVVALLINTLGGCFYLAGELELSVMAAGLLFGGIFSSPILIILLIIMNHCVSRRKDGLEIFRYVFISGIALTIFATIFFLALLPGTPPGLLFISIVAASTGIGLQYNAVFKLANYDDEFEKFLS
jgi:hypothetical protein